MMIVAFLLALHILLLSTLVTIGIWMPYNYYLWNLNLLSFMQSFYDYQGVVASILILHGKI